MYAKSGKRMMQLVLKYSKIQSDKADKLINKLRVNQDKCNVINYIYPSSYPGLENMALKVAKLVAYLNE